MPQTATETVLPDRATIARVALNAYNAWAGLPTLQQMSFGHPGLGEMIADAVLALSSQAVEGEVEWGVKRDECSPVSSRAAAESTIERQRKHNLNPKLVRRTVGPWTEVQP